MSDDGERKRVAESVRKLERLAKPMLDRSYRETEAKGREHARRMIDEQLGPEAAEEYAALEAEDAARRRRLRFIGIVAMAALLVVVAVVLVVR